MDLIDQPYFFIGAIVGFAIGRTMGLAIGGTVLTETDVAIGFSELSL